MDAPPVQYVKTRDGYDIAYTVSGHGRPLVLVPYPFNHVQLNWHAPGLRRWFDALSARFRFICYDSRGLGMSTRGLKASHSIADYDLDLATLLERLRLGRFALMAWGAFGHVAVRYAAAHPDELTALILKDCSATMTPWPSAHTTELPGDNWEVFVRGVVMSGTPVAEYDIMLDICRQAVTREDWQARARAFAGSTVNDILPQLTVPTLIIRGRHGALLTTEEAIRVASMIPDSRFVAIDGGFPGDATAGVQAIEDFIKAAQDPDFSTSASASRQPRGVDVLSVREIEVLKLIATGRSNPEISAELVISVNTVQNHVRSILSKAGLANRTEAAAYATRNGLV